MNQSFHYLLMANQALFHKSLLDSLKDTGLTIGQPKILDYLKAHDGASQKEIAKACHIEPGSLTVLLNRMEEQQMIERRMLNGNRRTCYVFLTTPGKALQEAVEQAFTQLEEDVFAQVSEDEKACFIKVFHQIYENMSVERRSING